jgi:hypothetical protein
MKWIATICVMLVCCGCVPLASDIQNLSGKLDIYQKEFTDVAEQMAKDGLVEKEKIDKLNEGFDSIKPVINDVAEGLKNAPYTDSKVENVLIGAKEGVTAAKDYITHSELIIGVLTVAGLFLEKKRRDVVKREVAKDAAINKYCGTSAPDVAAKLHDMVKEKTANL